MKVSMVFGGTKQELSRLCDDMKWDRKELQSHRSGWNGTVVSRDGEKIGFISTATRDKPCLLEVEPRSADEASSMVLAAFVAGALEKMS